VSLALSKNHTNPTVNTVGKTKNYFNFKVGGSTVLQRETKTDRHTSRYIDTISNTK